MTRQNKPIPRMDVPEEPIIPPSECGAALKLAEQMFDNIVLSGDVPEEIVEWAYRVRNESEELRKKFRSYSGKDNDAVWDAICTALLPTFHYGSEQADAGAALVNLMSVGGKYGWMDPEKAPSPKKNREAAPGAEGIPVPS